MKRIVCPSALLTLVAAIMLVAGPVTAQQPAKLSKEEAVARATDAYVYGYSLITTEVTRVQMSNSRACRCRTSPSQSQRSCSVR